MRLTGKKILLGVTGCIAAYKAAYLVRQIKKEGGEVKVVMTSSAREFITPLTMETLSENPVSSEMFPEGRFYSTHHISLAEWADLIVLAPATGNIIGKIASGIADDLLTTVVMAAQSKIMIAAAMNTHMYNNPVVQENMAKLKKLGYMFVEPTSGKLACNTEGVGRLAEPDDILEEIIAFFGSNGDLEGKNVLVTAGPTVEYFDAVRYISNPSSGKMGYAIAAAARSRGARVTLISGPTQISPPQVDKLVRVTSGSEMLDEVKKGFANCDMLFMVAAVSDYYPAEKADQKLKKSDQEITVKLRPRKDILQEIAPLKKNQVIIGFAMETEQGPENAKAKLENKKLDLIVLNNLNEEGSGFAVDTNRVTIISKDGHSEELPLLSKKDVAHKIIDHTLKITK